jgi:hypothetical protein
MPMTTDAELYAASNWYPSPPIILPSEGLNDLGDFQTVSWIAGSLILSSGLPFTTPLIVMMAELRDLSTAAEVSLTLMTAELRDLARVATARNGDGGPSQAGTSGSVSSWIPDGWVPDGWAADGVTGMTTPLIVLMAELRDLSKAAEVSVTQITAELRDLSREAPARGRT